MFLSIFGYIFLLVLKVVGTWSWYQSLEFLYRNLIIPIRFEINGVTFNFTIIIIIIIIIMYF